MSRLATCSRLIWSKSLLHRNGNCHFSRSSLLWRAAWRRLFTRWFWRAIGRWSRTDSSSWAMESQSSVIAFVFDSFETRPGFIWVMPTSHFYATPAWAGGKMKFEGSREAPSIRWLIRVIKLGLQLTLLHERRRVSPANFVLIAILFSWLRAKVFELLSLLNVPSAEQLQLPKNARQAYPVIRPQKIGEILQKDLSSWNSARSSTEWHCIVKSSNNSKSLSVLVLE